MNIPILLEDLIQHFKQNKIETRNSIQHLEELKQGIKKSLTRQFLQTGGSLILELLLWIGVVACIGIIIFLEKLYPFSLIHQFEVRGLPDGILPDDLSHLNWTLRLLFVLIGISFFWTAKILSRGRRRIKEINQQSKTIKNLMEELLQHQTRILALENKYPVDLGNMVDDEDQKPDTGTSRLPGPDGDILL